MVWRTLRGFNGRSAGEGKIDQALQLEGKTYTTEKAKDTAFNVHNTCDDPNYAKPKKPSRDADRRSDPNLAAPDRTMARRVLDRAKLQINTRRERR